MYSTAKFWRDWRFSIDKDFVRPSGNPFKYSHNGLREWGAEDLKIPFDNEVSGPKSAAFSHDGRYIAMNMGLDVVIWDIVDPSPARILQGHVSQVDFIAFRPGHATQLVSSAQDNYVGSKKAKSELIFWDLSEAFQESVTQEDIERVARNTANTIIAELKSVPSSIRLDASDQRTFANSLEDPVWSLIRRNAVAKNFRLFGRLAGHFQSQIFSPSGKYMCYMPGEAPESNGNADWELRLYAVDEHEDAHVLHGHRDAIMWTGFNQDETLIASASWDATFRVWDTMTGQLKHSWSTQGQNWTGGFSPDGRYFAGTSGDNKLYVYDLSDGSQHMTFDYGPMWCRALSWHPFEPLIAVGGTGYGKLFLIDTRGKHAVQHRLLSPKASKIPAEFKKMNPCFGQLEVTNLQFVDNGRKIAFYTSGDGSAEVYDIAECVKWRFARKGTMNAPEDDTPVTSKGGFSMVVREDQSSNKVLIASVDTDALRLWTVPMTL